MELGEFKDIKQTLIDYFQVYNDSKFKTLIQWPESRFLLEHYFKYGDDEAQHKDLSREAYLGM